MLPPIPLLVLIFVCVAMPPWLAWRIARLDEPTRSGWLVSVADNTIFVALIVLVGRWDIAGVHTRSVVVVLFAAAVVVSLLRHRGRPWRAADGTPLWRSHMTRLVSLVLFGAALVYVAAGLLPGAGARMLAFPLEGGRFIIGHGGGNTLLNHHSGHREQHWALDITALNPAGFRASGLLPEDLSRYVIHGATVVSPCAGEIMETRDGLPDLVPPQRDPGNATGNSIVIACGGMRVVLAHLLEGSIEVAMDETVVSGQPLARVGNSGNTTEPHLHIHAVDAGTGAGVPIAFAGVTPVRNRIFVRE